MNHTFKIEVFPVDGGSNISTPEGLTAINKLELTMLVKQQQHKQFSNRFYTASRSSNTFRLTITTSSMSAEFAYAIKNILLTTLQQRDSELTLNLGDKDSNVKVFRGRYVPKTLQVIPDSKEEACKNFLTFQYQGILQ